VLALRLGRLHDGEQGQQGEAQHRTPDSFISLHRIDNDTTAAGASLRRCGLGVRFGA
jgi:hypothetical protein